MVRRYPGGLVYPLVGEDATSNDKIVQSTEVSKSISILVHFSEGMLSHDFLVASVVLSHLRIEIPHQDVDVLVLQLVQNCL